MSNAIINIGTSVSYGVDAGIARALQAVMTQLHRAGINYQVRIAFPRDHEEAGEFPTRVLFVGPSNPPEFAYPSFDVPDVHEDYVPMVERFISQTMLTGTLDLIAIRDAFETLQTGTSTD